MGDTRHERVADLDKGISSDFLLWIVVTSTFGLLAFTAGDATMRIAFSSRRYIVLGLWTSRDF